MPTTDYLELNNFREAMEVMLNLTPKQEAALAACLSKPQGKYNAVSNNCGSPVQNCLENIGIDTQHQTLPVSLGNMLIDLGIVNEAKDYPASKLPTGTSSPWAK